MIAQIIETEDSNEQKEKIKVLNRIDKSNSAELRRVRNQIASQIFGQTRTKDERMSILEKIENIYLTNNIPEAGKRYLVFEELHPNFLGKENNNREDESYGNIPSLSSSSMTGAERKEIILSDLLMCALESNSRNLRAYLEMIKQGNLCEKLLEGKKIGECNDAEKAMLSQYRDILYSLYQVIISSSKISNDDKQNDDKQIEKSDDLASDFEKLEEFFKGDTAIESIEKIRKEVHNRNVNIAKEVNIELNEGDYLKGIESTEYFPSMLQNGILAKDFLGGSASHDFTPLDTDVAKVVNEKGTFLERITTSNANGYTNANAEGKKLGKILLVFAKDDFIETRDSSGIKEEAIKELEKNKDKKEAFCNNSAGDYSGIRTGIGSTHIKYIIAEQYIDKLGLEIAKNGFYIPIVNEEGKIIFTPEMYEEFRCKMQGLSHYGEKEFVVDKTARSKEIEGIIEYIEANEQACREKKDKILEVLKTAVTASNCELSVERKTDLKPGIIEFIDTGSTGRGTNEPGDGDFDFMVRMDRDLSNAPGDFKDRLEKALTSVEKREVTGTGDFRYKGVKIEGLNEKIDLDLTFTERTNEIEYSTDECIKDRLRTIKSVSQDDYKYVIANILLAKQFLKNAGAYKKKDAPSPENGKPDTRGGLGAVGIENWVLQNGGSFQKAAESFLSVASECNSFSEFIERYSVWDFGENHISSKKIYIHMIILYIIWM